MESEQLVLAIDVRVEIPETCGAGLQNILSMNEAKGYLYDRLCSWIWRCCSPADISFDLDVNVTVTQQ